jgi:low affinity Fe/Cu permease
MTGTNLESPRRAFSDLRRPDRFAGLRPTHSSRARPDLAAGQREAVSRNLGNQGNAGFLATFAIMPLKSFRAWLTEMGVLAARPAAFAVFAIYGAAWITFGNGLEWHSLATLATWGMTLVIQRAEHRDTQAIHAKLDELLKATGRANNELMSIDDKDAEEIERERENVQRS